MSISAQDTSVEREVVVATTPEKAFRLFTKEIERWWLKEHHLIEGELAATVFEPHVGGRIYDRASDGSTVTWAHVLAYEPPRRVVFSWDISPEWKIEEDPARRSEVEVTFSPAGDGTRVTLIHRHLERLGDGWQSMRDAVANDEMGWAPSLAAYAAAAAS